MLTLKRNNPALSNGQYGGELELLATENKHVFAFRRTVGGNVVRVAVNLSATAQPYRAADGATQSLAAWRWKIHASW